MENVGKDKIYDKIIHNLLIYASKRAVRYLTERACISLRPKRQIAQYYIDKYKMDTMRMTLSLEVPKMLELIELITILYASNNNWKQFKGRFWNTYYSD